jgi:hypothetical protein
MKSFFDLLKNYIRPKNITNQLLISTISVCG